MWRTGARKQDADAPPPAPDPAPPPAPEPAPEAPQESEPSPPKEGDVPSVPAVPKLENHYVPIMVITGLFGAMFIILPLLVRKGPNRGIFRCCIMLSVFCIWIFWVTIYIAQMNPIMGPRMRNTTVAWIAYRFGDPIKPATPSVGGEGETM